MKNKFYLVLWLSQTVSQLGSAMTAYALALWVYGKSGRAFDVSLLTLCTWLPFVLISPLAGVLTDRLPKKPLLLLPDAAAAVGTLLALLLYHAGTLSFLHICGLNTLLGSMNALQNPASAVAVGLLVPPSDLPRAAGLRGFSDSAVALCAPMLAAGLLSAWGMQIVFLCDLLSFCLAFSCVLLLVRLPPLPTVAAGRVRQSIWEGFSFLRRHSGLKMLIGSMALLNLLSRLTYENILSPMLLARSGSAEVVGAVSSMLGLAGILGGLAVAADKHRRNPVLLIYGAAALSFLLGDLPMGIGQSLPVWLAAGFFASFPIPWISAGQNVLLYGTVPQELQGRVFAARNALQQGTVPVGLLLGGLMADHIFEPMMASGRGLSQVLVVLVGTGPGSGMAVMFLCTGILGSVFSVICLRSKTLKILTQQMQKTE